MDIKFAIITSSDTRSIEEDTAGAALVSLVEEAGWSVTSHVIVKDEAEQISAAIVDAADVQGANIVLTCGGTGLSMRDVTPEATMAVCQRNVPGIAEAIRAASLAKTSHAMTSRAVCMQRGKALVINFPSSERAARECWEVVADEFEHIIHMTNGAHHHHEHGHGHHEHHE